METMVPHAAPVLYSGGAGGEEAARDDYCSDKDTYTGRYRHLRDDDLEGWRDKAMRLVKDFAMNLPYAEEDRPDDPAIISAREFLGELLDAHPWLDTRIPARI